MPALSGGSLWLTAICKLCLVLFIPGGTGSDCYAKQHPNGTTTFYFNATEIQLFQSYSWKINGIAQATEEKFKGTIIESRGPHYVNFKSCYSNVTYWSEHSGKTINCPYNCLTARSTPASLATTPAPGLIILGVVAVATCILIFGCCILVWKKRWLQNRGCSWWKYGYNQAVQDHSMVVV